MQESDYEIYGIGERDFDAVEHVEEIAPSFNEDYDREQISE